MNINPWDAAEQAKETALSNTVWGQCEANSWFCVLEKGIGKREFDPQLHSLDQRRTAIDITITPLPEMDLPFLISRSMIAESREWLAIVLPSIRALGISPRDLNGKWVKAQIVPVTDKNGNPLTYVNSSGVTKEKTTVKFLSIFSGEQACRADYLAESGSPDQVKSTNPPPANGNKEKETAYAFLKVYVKNACRGETAVEAIRAKLTTMLEQQPFISKYFSADSPEVAELIAEYLATPF